jgi:RIP homotypic interaction motif
MKDAELRAIVLQKFYEERRKVVKIWGDSDLPSGIAAVDFYDICGQLAQHGLISWDPIRDTFTINGGAGKITARGVDVVEGTAEAPIAIIFDQRTITITDSDNVQVGDHNSLSGRAN